MSHRIMITVPDTSYHRLKEMALPKNLLVENCR